MFTFDNLKSIANILDINGLSLKKEEKQFLANLLKKVLEVEDEQSIGNVVTALEKEIKNTLKTELTEEVKTQLKADQVIITAAINALKAEEATKTAAKVGLSDEILEKANKFEQIEKENKELEAKVNAVEQEKTDLQKQLEDLTNEQEKVNTTIENLFEDGSIETEIEGLIKLTGQEQELEDALKVLYDEKLESVIEDVISKIEIEDEDKEQFRELWSQKGIMHLITEGNQGANEVVKAIEKELKLISTLNKESLVLYIQVKAKKQEAEELKDENENLKGQFTRVSNELEAVREQAKQADTEKTVLQKQLEDLKDEQKKVNGAIEKLFVDNSIKTEMGGLIKLTGQDLTDKVKSLYEEKLKNTIENIIGNDLSEMKDEDKEELHKGLQSKIKSIIETDQSKNVDEIVKLIKPKLTDDIISAGKFNKEVANLEGKLVQVNDQLRESTKLGEELETQLNGSLKKIDELNDEVQKLKAAQNPALLKTKDNQIKTLKDEVQQLQNAPLKDSQQTTEQIEALTAQVEQLEKKNKELEAENKKIQQLKQGNGARYTATVGMVLAAGLVAFTALERTVRLEMLVMIGIAVASALVVGGITYAALPSTQVDGAESQGVSGNNKGK
ncbi:hypothetical protein [Wolbachia endosymbiont of Oedothorax gibbosus]|uniref:hypothetical protein n=1 Tax=Wolbachia endosymbiont of Oedothorax gibbosus TaxID=931100 RepID=UPI0020248BC8|nr:hypothetical protein [Wolbachia endosymbiont of Oedothorax gibbosus]